MNDKAKTKTQLIAELRDLRQQVSQSDEHYRAIVRDNQVLLEISQMLASSLEPSTILQQIVEAAASLIGQADRAVIHLLDEEENILEAVAIAGPDKQSISQRLSFTAGEGIAGLALATSKTINVTDAPKDPRYLPANVQEERVRSLLVAPVKTSQKNLGTLSVHSRQPGVFSARDENLLTIFATQAALALAKAQLFESTQRRFKEINALYGITQGLIESFDVDAMLQQIVTLLQEYFGYYYIQVFLIEPSNGDLVLRQGSGEIGRRLKLRGFRLTAGVGIAGRAAASGYPFVTNNVKESPFFVSNALLPETCAELAVPLRAGERILGVLDLHHKHPNMFTDYDVRLMSTVANQVAVALEKLNIYADLQAALQQEQSTRAQLVQSEKLAALGRIVASVAHELNNPLQAIQNALYLVKVTSPLDPQSQEDLLVALNEASRMADLIARLRETYRPTSGEEFRFESLNTIFDEVQKLLSTHLNRNNIVWQFEPASNLPLAPLIRDQMKQVILNICLNAVEAMANGGKLISRTRYVSAKHRVYFTITDSGMGIPEDVLPYIFDPFVTTKEVGTGLGLAITYDIVRRHNGQIEVDSKPGKGTTFTVWLPLKQ